LSLPHEASSVEGGRSPTINRSPNGRRIPYAINRPVPRRVDKLVADGTLTQTDRDVLLCMLNVPSTRDDSCWTTKETISVWLETGLLPEKGRRLRAHQESTTLPRARRSGTSVRTVQYAWERLEAAGVLTRVEFGREGDPCDERNMTGRRFFFCDFPQCVPEGRGADRRAPRDRKRGRDAPGQGRLFTEPTGNPEPETGVSNQLPPPQAIRCLPPKQSVASNIRFELSQDARTTTTGQSAGALRTHAREATRPSSSSYGYALSETDIDQLATRAQAIVPEFRANQDEARERVLASARVYGPMAEAIGLSFSARWIHYGLDEAEKHGRKPGNLPVKNWIWVEGVFKNLIKERRNPPEPEAPRPGVPTQTASGEDEARRIAVERAAISYILEQLTPAELSALTERAVAELPPSLVRRDPTTSNPFVRAKIYELACEPQEATS
jgi:hypothetical protein